MFKKQSHFYVSLIVFPALLISSFSVAQPLQAKNIVATLASPQMHGRGYVNDGHKLAAAYIADVFKKDSLAAYKNSYFQHFPLAVNTFTGKITVKAEDKELVPGADFIIAPYSRRCSGSFELHRFSNLIMMDQKASEKFFKKHNGEKAVIIDEKEIKPGEEFKLFDALIHLYKARAIIVVRDKLTWSISGRVENFSVIEVRRGAINETTENITIDYENQLLNDSSQNIIAYLPPSYPSATTDSIIVFTAHYDHLGKMGDDTYFPGANDNASGVAMLLTLAAHYTKQFRQCTFVFIGFGGEESGLAGSRHFVNNPLFPLTKIKFLINFDLVGTGNEGITIVNGSVFKKEFNQLLDINKEKDYLSQIKERGAAANSDHHPFYEKGVKSFFIYTMGGIKAYHDIYDKAETLPLNEFEDVFKLITEFIAVL